MSVRNKIIIIIVPLMLISVIAVSLVSGVFFSRYLESEERAQMVSIGESASSYVNVQQSKYQANANKWGHWDDTYNFMLGDSTYIDSNLTEQSFKNLDVNFIIYTYHGDWIYFQQYYDFKTGEFVDFDSDFVKDFYGLIRSEISMEDMSSALKLGDNFYFVASSDITDSLKQKNPAGRIFIGRLLGIADIEKATGCKTVSISANPSPSDEGKSPLSVVSKDSKNIVFQWLIPVQPGGTQVMLTFEKPRDLYVAGMREFIKFILVGALYYLGISVILFTLLSIFLTKPFARLIKDVKGIDLKAINKINIKGKDEFAFVRTSINSMLEQIVKEQALVRENEEKLYATLQSVGDGVIVVGRDERIQFINYAAQRLTGWSQDEAMGKPFAYVFRLISEDTGDAVASPIREVFETEKVIEVMSHTLLLSKEGARMTIEDTVAPVKDKNGQVVSCVIVFRDFSEKKEEQKRIEYLSYHDQLTGLYNRRYFEEELRRLDTKRNLPISLIYADIDGLKIINDAFGHQSGDQLIKKVAKAMRDTCREDEIISRTGGDEFIILLVKTDKDSAERLLERIDVNAKRQKIMGIAVSLSLGCDTKYSEEHSIRDTLNSAEDSMYHKKIMQGQAIRFTIIESALKALHAKSPGEEGHSKRTGELCVAIGEAAGLSQEEQKELKSAGELHDIGKIAIDEDILNNANALNESEWVQLQSHPETGYRILSTSSGFHEIAEYVLAQHERWDGKGYPKGLAGKEIPKMARIIAIADAFDSMTHSAPYKKALPKEQAIDELKKNSGTQFDPELVKIFIEKVLKRD